MKEFLSLLIGLLLGLTLYDFGLGASARSLQEDYKRQVLVETSKNEGFKAARSERDATIDKLIVAISALTEEVKKKK